MQKVVDIVKLAIANEVKAKAYYEQAFELTVGGESLMVFIELIEMEATHAQRLVDAFGATLQAAGVDAEAYLAELEGRAERVLSADETAPLQGADMRAVLDHAIGMEVRARDSYLELADRVEGDKLRKLCQDLAAEEQQHHDQLTEARSGVDMPIDERPAL
jgi:rubrerythrin